MKKKCILVLVLCVIISSIAVLSSCAMTKTDRSISDNFDNLAKGYSTPDGKTGAKGEEITFVLDGEKEINSIVLKESGDNIKRFELYANGALIYGNEHIGKYRYCSFETVKTAQLTLKVLDCKKDWKIKGIEAYNITGTDRKDFRVMSYATVDTLYNPSAEKAELMRYTTQFNIFGATHLDSNGNIYLQDYTFGSKEVSGAEVLSTSIANIRKYNPSASIVVTVLGRGDGISDGLEIEERYSKAMGDNADKLIGECLRIIEEYDLDGVTFDYEYPYTAKSNKIYGKFLEKLDEKLPADKELNIALSLWNIGGINGFPVKQLEHVDHIELMTYDSFDDWGDHAGFYNTCADALYQAERKGLDMTKVDLGLPFYSRPTDKAGYWGNYYEYAELLGKYGNSIVETIRPNPDGEAYDITCYYNGWQTIYDKTCYALDIGLAGVMIWHFDCDTTDEELSLYRAIDTARNNRA